MTMAEQLENRDEITRMLDRWVAGERSVLTDLAEALYPQWRRMAQAHFRNEPGGHVLQATGLVHEAYLALAELRPHGFASRKDFHALVGRLMRQILVDHARRIHAAKRGGGVVHVGEEFAEDIACRRAEEFLVLDDALGRLSAMSERKAQVIELRYFSGLSLEEVAEELEISVATAYREQRMAEAWLGKTIGA